ncbi:RNA polymerase II-associated protein 1-like, partial [Oculina patagonica]
MFSRPESKETESDLLRFQEQFLAGRLNPSAAVVRSNTPTEEPRSSSAGDKRELPCGAQVERDVVTLEGLPAVQPSSRLDPGFPPKKKSRFKTRRQDAHTTEQRNEEDVDGAELLDIHDRHVTSVLTQIKEREVPHRSFTTPRVSERGFPMALHRGNIDEQALSTKGTSSEGRRSLFAQQFAASGAVRFGVPKQNDDSQKTEEKPKVIKLDSTTRITEFPKPTLISGKGLVQHTGEKSLLNKEVEEIHNENIAKLESMTQEEILEEQARIKASLDPSLLAFLTSQRQRNIEKTTEAGSEEEKAVGCHDIKNSSVQVESGHDEKHVHFSDDVEMITQENGQEIPLEEQSDGKIKIGELQVSDKWLHMGTLESEKLEWMKDCPAPRAVESKQGNQARFDFNGCLVSKTDDIPEYLGLHHHGDDPSSPGYTLEELFVLARSSFLQQRVFALQVLARIIRQDQMGAFQGHLHGDVLSVLLDAGVLFLLRWSLDDTSDAVVAAAIQGFAAILIVPNDK